MGTDGFHNWAGESHLGPVCEICGDATDEKDSHGTLMCSDCQDEDTCDADGCTGSLSDGEGYDGYCGTHADKVENHNEGQHAGDGRDAECPEC